MQNCFAHPNGNLYSEQIVNDINKFINHCRKEGASVVYTKDTHTKKQFEESDNYDEFKRRGEHAVKTHEIMN